jgi:hypothetical protein
VATGDPTAARGRGFEDVDPFPAYGILLLVALLAGVLLAAFLASEAGL